jgi:hypothetical protein
MAYSTSNPPALKTQRVGSGGNGGATWHYASVDSQTLVEATDYFTNGAELGMQVGDIVEVLDTDAPLLTISWVSAIDVDGNATVTELTETP